MQRDKNQGYEFENRETLSRRGDLIYYIGALLFISGIALLVVGTISILFFQIHYGSESQIILNVVLFIGSGLMFISLGINCMIHQDKKGYIVISMGVLFTVLSFILFLLNYQHNWYYPMISYILISYTIGLLMLMGNAFANVTVWLIRSNSPSESIKPKKVTYEYSNEEIEKDIENAVQKSLVKAADELQFDLVNMKPLKVGNAAFGSETIVKVKDDIKESYALEQTRNPGEREEWGAMGVDKLSNQLADALTEKPTFKKSRLKQFFSRHKK